MISGYIESFILSSGANHITEVFLWSLVGVFALACYSKKMGNAPIFTQYAPTLLTTLGILGTFAGIISGLLGFDVDDIDGSIATLLAGLKTAFVTSLAGMSLSIAYKIVQAFGLISPKGAQAEHDEEIGVAELYEVMRQQSAGIESLREALGGEGEGSLIGQLKLMRSDLGDQHKTTLKTIEPVQPVLEGISTRVARQEESFNQFQDRLWIKLQDFADMMSKSATEQVINALKEVISDFNNNLVEQFGDNFKKLNEAVLELVQWQENYKQQLLQMSEQYQQGVQAITLTENAVSHISEESKIIPASMQDLKSVMEVNQHQLEELQRHLDAFKDIRDRAVEAVPEIRAQIDETVKGMNEVAASINEGMSRTTETLVSGLTAASDVVAKEVTASVKAMSDGVAAAAEDAAKGISDAGSRMAEAVVGSSGELQKAIVTGSEEFIHNSQRVNESLQGTSGVIADNSEKSKQMFDDALSETNSILRGLISDLKDDSQKLTESYKAASQSLITETNSVRTSFEQGLTAMRQQLGAELQKMAEQQAQENQRVLTGMSQHADSALKDTAEAVQKQVKMLDDALNHELNRVMSEMGRALTTISGKFTSDYQQLVNEMHKITRTREAS